MPTDPSAAPLSHLSFIFATYKLVPGEPSPVITQEVYGLFRAEEIVTASIQDYLSEFGE